MDYQDVSRLRSTLRPDFAQKLKRIASVSEETLTRNLKEASARLGRALSNEREPTDADRSRIIENFFNRHGGQGDGSQRTQ